MQPFEQFLITEGIEKNVHLTHLEDVMFTDGLQGAYHALRVLRDFGRVLDGGKVSRAMNVSTKWDGAPAIVFGPDPADGVFFVATKAAFNKTPKLAKSHADIDRLYTSGVNAVLHLAFDELKKLSPTLPLQGDVLFSTDTKRIEQIDGLTYVTFRPNTILYAVPVSSDIADSIQRARLGLVLHTAYVGGTTLQSSRAVNIAPGTFAALQPGGSLFLVDATFDDLSGTVTFTSDERADFLLARSEADSAALGVDQRVFDLIATNPLKPLLPRFVNALVRQNKHPSPVECVNEFLLFLLNNKAKSAIDIVAEHRDAFVGLFKLHGAIQRAKNIVIAKLGQTSKIATFVATETGYQVTGPEGFVAISHGKAVKLVDRLEFSRLNFTSAKMWQ